MASIRGRGHHEVIVQRRTVGRKNTFVNYVNEGDPIVIKRCSVQSVREWATAEENYAYGLSQLSMRRVFARDWPGDVNSLVYFNGGEFETVGDPQHMDGSPRTEHWVITIKWLRDVPPPVIPEPPAPTP
ncbi:hypothetical protein ACSHWG_00890 [Leucobacter sp. Z1108]|uniref:hypothetical protein n=1 Tax=Leucobacter sp. Z1108 TaxID=3439066 RepID=UPI003F2F61EE